MNRLLLPIGFMLLAASSFWLGQVNLQIAMRNVIMPSILNGIGISFIFTPLTTAAVAHLRQHQLANATGIYHLMRNLGGSFGIALVSTEIVRRAQVHQALMVAHLSPFDPAYNERLAAVTQVLSAHAGPVLAHEQAQQLLYQTLLNQSSLWAFVDNFRLFGFVCLLCIPLILLFKKSHGKRQAPGSH